MRRIRLLMIEFKDNIPIYRQIVEFAFNRILDGTWVPGTLIPSVRELTLELGVNNRTVLKAFDELQSLEVVVPRRGMGYLLADDAPARVREVRKRDFFGSLLPRIVEEMKILGIRSADVAPFLEEADE